MVGNVSTIGSLATYLVEVFPQMSTGVSGNLIIIADNARQYVQNYTGVEIGSNSINQAYQGAILDFAKADTIDLINAQAGGEKVRLAELSLEETGEELSAEQYRALGEMKLRSIGKNYQIARTLA